MAESHWTLTHGTDQTYVPELDVTPQSTGGKAQGCRIHKYRLQGGMSDGVDVVHIDNGVLSFDVLPTRGMGIWKAWLGGEAFGWNSPVRGPIQPALVPLSDPSGLGWLDGFDELLVRCGLESNGAPEFDEQGRVTYGLHGRIANKPAHRVELHVEEETGEIALSGVVDEVRFHFFKLRMRTTITTRCGQPWLEVHDTIENLSGSPTQAQLLYHINFGPPLLQEGSQVVVPVGALVPRNPRAVEGLANWAAFDAPRPGFEEQVYFFDLQSDAQQRTAVLLKNAASDRGVSVHFDTQQLPCFTLWKNPTAESDGYVTGLEPATNFPNPRSFEQQQGRVVSLAPGGKATFDLRLEIHPTAAEVTRIEQHINGLCRSPATIHDQPQPQWCA